MSYRRADVFIHATKAGVLEETDSGYRFQYDAQYLAMASAEAVSLTLPLRAEAYESQVLFPFFDGISNSE